MSRVGIALLLFIALAAMACLQQMDKLLKAMHLPAGASYGMNDLARLLPTPRPSSAEVIAGWSSWQDRYGHEVWTTYVSLAHTYVKVDSFIFVPAYAALLAIVAWRLRTLAVGPAQTRALTLALWGTVPLAFADELENFAQWHLVDGDQGGYAVLARIGWTSKWILLAYLVFTLLGACVLRLLAAPEARSEVVNCRIQILVALVVVLLFNGPGPFSEQSADVLRRWTDDFRLIPIPIVLVFLVAVLMLISGQLVISAAGSPQSLAAASPGPYALVGVSASIVGGAALALATWKLGGPHGLYIVAAVIGVVGLLSLPYTFEMPNVGAGAVAGAPPPAPASWPTVAGNGLAASVACVPPIVLGIATTAAGIGQLVYSGEGRAAALLAAGLGILLAGCLFFAIVRIGAVQALLQAPPAPVLTMIAQIGIWVVAVLLASAALLFTWTHWASWTTPWEFARFVNGTIGVVFVFSLVVLVVGTGLVLFAELVAPAPFFYSLRMHRTPILSLFAIWFLLASFVDPGDFHRVRTLTAQSAEPETLTAAFGRWQAEHGLTTPGAPGKFAGRREGVPIIFVGAAGGGIRAAYWTALVMSCLVEKVSPCDGQKGPAVLPSSIFAASGVSGGSLGLVAYRAHQEDPEKSSPKTTWVDERLADDYLAPTLARTLFVDLPNAFLRLGTPDDRAAVLEKSWERNWPPDNPLGRGLFAESRRWPLLLLNGTSVAEGCRFEISTLSSSSLLRHDLRRGELVDGCLSLRRFDRPSERRWFLAATKDMRSYLCPTDDLRLSTAALLSARFPILSPSGKVQCMDGPPAYVVDGGYFENTGIGTIDELWAALAPKVDEFNRTSSNKCIVPMLVQIDNHYFTAAGPGNDPRPRELLVPTHTLGLVRNGREAEAREAGALSFSRDDLDVRLPDGNMVNRVAQIYPLAHPGTEAPLGWTLSRMTQEDLSKRLADKDGELTATEAATETVRGWFSGITCGPARERRGRLDGSGP